jgi:very-short-patch-repair endonuclease
MWRLLHSLRTNGYHFRKQVKLGAYYADFACLHAKLVIEVDGSTHGTDIARHNDALRDDYLKGRGFTVLRFFAGDVLDNETSVGETIVAALAGMPRSRRDSPPPSLGPLRRFAPSSTTLPAVGEGGAGTSSDAEDMR